MPVDKQQAVDPRDLKIWLGSTAYVQKEKDREVSEHRMIYSKITASTAEELSLLFTTHLRKIIAENSGVSFLSLLHHIELAGVRISAIPHTALFTGKEVFAEGILINETKNTLAVFLGSTVKIFPKAMYNFLLYIDTRKYFVIGPALKHTRRYT
ncbi:hypothetical protein NECID01_0644 [Nematocida sp. AWRm77]|nr:hypothetical protein NECID01_0644 [Nematocida sp. AWRm77]